MISDLDSFVAVLHCRFVFILHAKCLYINWSLLSEYSILLYIILYETANSINTKK